MYEAMMIAATGLHNQQRRLDVIANNVSNVNTVGFRSSRLDFKEALYTAGIVPGLPRTPEGNQQKGHGVMVTAVTRNFAGGSILNTERQLDLAIEGEGFFSLLAPDGTTVYSRNGAFNLSVEPDGVYLVNESSMYVLDRDGMRIRVPELTETISANLDGTLTFTVGEDETHVAMGVYTFRNITGLMAMGDGTYSESVASGVREDALDALIRQGVLEGSNVSLPDEMTRMIRTQRAFSLSSRALTTADEMEGIANNMRR